jgi:hypothetical protein
MDVILLMVLCVQSVVLFTDNSTTQCISALPIKIFPYVFANWPAIFPNTAREIEAESLIYSALIEFTNT